MNQYKQSSAANAFHGSPDLRCTYKLIGHNRGIKPYVRRWPAFRSDHGTLLGVVSSRCLKRRVSGD